MLAKVLFWLCAALGVALFVCVMYAKKQKANATKYRVKYEESNKMVAGLTRTINELRKEEAIKSENRKETEKKIEALHDGDTVDNALNELRKR